ncbi:long-chain-fatty-acid--CoA ligase [Sphingomonas montana]|uniref:long-chain-fatty-acid--CoA ligase n=1 Tax=Sphingomonas montana TaxID=1843236 RepID=UPI00096CB2C0|nr:long-chain-fatty-acid--CoA ligase [Sphingomonas montana]
MLGLMQDWPMTVDRIIDHAATWHGTVPLVERAVDGFRSAGWADVRSRARRLSGALLAAGIRPGDRVATMAWNGIAHIEAWFGIMGIGAVCHTLNPRLFADQIVWIVNHAADRILIVDATLYPVIAPLRARMPTLERILVIAADTGALPDGTTDYDAFVADGDNGAAWGQFDENSACGLCYTSGTTGNPKGVLYSHRSNYLHTLMTLQADIMGLSSRDVVLPIVPMFHANAWGLVFSAPAVGAQMVLPGPRLDGASVAELIERHGVTFSAAVPTVWLALLQYLKASGRRPDTLRRVAIGGSACPAAIIRDFNDLYGVEVVHLWGMTETSPVGSCGAMTPALAALPHAEQLPWRLKQGRPALGIDMRLVADDGTALPHDGRTVGHLLVRGPAVVRAYLNDPTPILDEDGWFDTGDIATIDGQGFMQITDRAKDVIKSGGEWISSIEIENIVVGHPQVAVAAVIGIPHPKWDERPLLIVQPIPGRTPAAADLLAHLDGRIARWWMPDRAVFLSAIPLGATGKIDKKALRAMAETGAFDEVQADFTASQNNSGPS